MKKISEHELTKKQRKSVQIIKQAMKRIYEECEFDLLQTSKQKDISVICKHEDGVSSKHVGPHGAIR